MSRAVEYTRAQRLAMALDRNLSVTAGAGTGKTRVLTGRLLRILALAARTDPLGTRMGARPHQLVAVTFTRKAANEMRERIMKAVSDQVRAAQTEGNADAFAYWVALRRELSEATIQTIHGLSARLVRLAALDLGVDPKFRVVEGIDARLLVEDSMRAVLARVPDEAQRGLRELYVLRGANGVRGILRALVGDRVHADAWAARLTGSDVEVTLDWLWDALVPVGPEEAEGILADVRRMHEDLGNRVRVAPPEESKAHGLFSVLACCAAAGDSAREKVGALWALVDHCTSQEGTWYKAPHHATGPAREWDAMGLGGEGKRVYGELEGLLAPVVGRLHGVPGDADRRVLMVLQALAAVYRAVVDRYDDAKRRLGFLDYHDLEVLARQALNRPGVAESLRRRWRYLLVDEFQDTNENQWAILRELARAPVESDASPIERTQDALLSGGWSSGEELASGKPRDAAGTDDAPTHAAHREADEGGLRLVELSGDDDPGEAGVLGEDRLFIVGDSKQSIYSFRGADVTVYETSRDAVKEANAFHGLDQDPLDVGDPGDAEDLGEPGDLGGAGGEADGAPPDCTEEECRGEVRLDRNFRSLPALVHFTNRFFDRLLRPHDPDEGRQRFEARPGPLHVQREGLIPGPDTGPGPMVKGSVRLLVTPAGFDEAVQRGDLSAQQADRLGATRYQFARLVQDIRRCVEGPEGDRLWVKKGKKKEAAGAEPARSAGYRDVAVLLPRKTNLRLLEEQMRKHGVPYVVVGGRGFWSRQGVWDAVNLLAVVADPRRDVELFSVLRSPFFAWSDETVALLAGFEGGSLWSRLCRVADGELEWVPPGSFEGTPPHEVVECIKRWGARSAATSAARLLMEVLGETPYMAALASHEPETTGRMAVENLEKLVGLVRRLEDRRGRSLVPLVRDLLSLADEDAEEAEAVLPGEEEVGVRVMTVHAAKGLQFPVVYVAELDAPLQTGFSQDARGLQFARVGGEPFYVFKGRGDDGEEEDSFVRRVVRDAALRRAHAEYKRLLYVAATRAEDHLVFIGCSQRLGAKPGRNAPALKEVEKGRSWMDWMERILGLSDVVYDEIVRQDGRRRGFTLQEDAARPGRVEVDVEPADLDREGTIPVSPMRPQAPREEDQDSRVRVQPAPPTAAAAAVRVSPSQLLVYAECKARFRYRVIEGLTEGWVRGVRGRVPQVGEEFGSLLHRALAAGATIEEPLPEAVERRARALAQRHQEHGWPSPDGWVEQLRLHAKRAVKTFAAELDPRPVLVESGVDAEVAPGLRVVGRLDRVHRDRDGRFVVVDLKSDSVDPGNEPDHAKRHGHDAQVALYDVALRRAGFETGAPALLYSATGHLHRIAHDPDPDGDVLSQLARRIEETRTLQSREDAAEPLQALWPRTAPGVRTCQGCGYWRNNGGPCEGVGQA